MEDKIIAELTKEEMNIVRNGMLLILSLSKREKLDLSNHAKDLYEGVYNKFDLLYENKWHVK